MSDMDDTIIKAKVDVTKGRSDEFNDIAQELSAFIEGLDLDLVQHGKLIARVFTQIRVAERDAFNFGFAAAVKLMHDYYSDEEE